MVSPSNLTRIIGGKENPVYGGRKECTLRRNRCTEHERCMGVACPVKIGPIVLFSFLPPSALWRLYTAPCIDVECSDVWTLFGCCGPYNARQEHTPPLHSTQTLPPEVCVCVCAHIPPPILCPKRSIPPPPLYTHLSAAAAGKRP